VAENVADGSRSPTGPHPNIVFIVGDNVGWGGQRRGPVHADTLSARDRRYEDGASDNTGLGMREHEFLLGTAVYLNEQRTFHSVTTSSMWPATGPGPREKPGVGLGTRGQSGDCDEGGDTE
jgi:hypothetical protein